LELTNLRKQQDGNLGDEGVDAAWVIVTAHLLKE